MFEYVPRRIYEKWALSRKRQHKGGADGLSSLWKKSHWVREVPAQPEHSATDSLVASQWVKMIMCNCFKSPFIHKLGLSVSDVICTSLPLCCNEESVWSLSICWGQQCVQSYVSHLVGQDVLDTRGPCTKEFTVFFSPSELTPQEKPYWSSPNKAQERNSCMLRKLGHSLTARVPLSSAAVLNARWRLPLCREAGCCPDTGSRIKQGRSTGEGRLGRWGGQKAHVSCVSRLCSSVQFYLQQNWLWGAKSDTISQLIKILKEKFD